MQDALKHWQTLLFQDGIVVVETVTLPKDSVIKLEFAEDLSSKTAKAGDVVKYKVADNVFVNDVLVLPKGYCRKALKALAR